MTDTAPPPANRFVEDARRSYIERTRPPERDSTPGGEGAECLPGDDSVADANAPVLNALRSRRVGSKATTTLPRI